MPYTNNLTSIELYPTVSDSCVCHITSLVSQVLPSSVRHRYSDREQNRKAAYPADASDGRDLCRVAIREHLVEVTPKQMHLVSSQIELSANGQLFLCRSADRAGGRCGFTHGSRATSASSLWTARQRRLGSPHCEPRNLRRHHTAASSRR